ncbi:hypothetical protein H5410_049239 [Solanum commersonii]|uniref:Uncharacterized protein n=1 Tax=Solanum commersonii TaxID=4109 RepID=A0A9J5XLS5_SOLCO|nr:hypothetical protein H5410_049239 [Solanum commersonii]
MHSINTIFHQNAQARGHIMLINHPKLKRVKVKIGLPFQGQRTRDSASRATIFLPQNSNTNNNKKTEQNPDSQTKLEGTDGKTRWKRDTQTETKFSLPSICQLSHLNNPQRIDNGEGDVRLEVVISCGISGLSDCSRLVSLDFGDLVAKKTSYRGLGWVAYASVRMLCWDGMGIIWY